MTSCSIYFEFGVEPSPDDSGHYVATCDELGISTYGRSAYAAEARMAADIRAYMVDMLRKHIQNEVY